MTIPARLSIVTLAVADLERSVRFYAALGWPKASSSNEQIAWFDVGGSWLGVHPRELLAEDAAAADEPAGFAATFAINVASESEVDAAMALARAAGAEISRPAERVDWGGYRGYFADPDGHRWEVAHNPFFAIDPGGRLQIP